MRHFVLTLLVALLAFSVSGAASALVPEPCSLFEAAGDDDRACAPTCVTCGCCHQATDIQPLLLPTSPDLMVDAAPSRLPATVAGPLRDILHVPRPFIG